MPENESKIISVNIDDYQYYIRRDERLSQIEKLIKKVKADDYGVIDVDKLALILE